MSIKNSSFAQLTVYDGPFSVNKSLANNFDGSVASFTGDSDGGLKPLNTTVIVQDITPDPLLARSRLQFYNRDAPVWCVENRGADLKMIKDNVTHLRLDEFGDAFFSGNVTITGDLFADDISYDVETVNLMKVNTEIQHLNNATNRIAFDTDKMTLDASGAKIVLDNNIAEKITMTGNVKMMNDLEVVGDITLDDINTDVITLKDRIQHDGNTSNFIAFDTDKMTFDASGTSIVLDDAAMADKITITGATKFINEINAVPDINLANHIIHLADTNTKIGFPANDQIALATGGTDRVLVTDSRTTIGPELAIADGTPRIKGNMTGSPTSSRLAIQNSTLNGNSRFYVIPNGTGNISAINFRNDSAFDDTLPFQAVDLGIVAGESRLTASGANGSPAPDITFRNNAVEIYRQSATQTTHKATSTNTTAEILFRVIDQNDIPLFYVDGRGGVTSSTTGTALGSFNTIRCDSGTSDAYFRLARGNSDKWLIRNVSATDNFMLSPDNTDLKGFHMDQAGNVMIGQSTSSYKFAVNSGTGSGNTRFISETNAGCDVGWITGTGTAANTKFSIIAQPSVIGDGYGQVALRTRVNNTFPTALLLDGNSDATFGNDIFIGGTAGITKTNSNGSINMISVNGAKKVFANINPPNPYTGTVRVVITWSTWGGNNTGCLINLTANARIYSGTFGYVNGFVTATQSAGGTTFTAFSTANLVQSNITTTVTAPGNYQLQIDLDPTGNCDRFTLEMTVPEGGTGSAITAVQITIV